MKRLTALVVGLLVAGWLTGCCSSCRAYQKLQRPLTATEWRLVQLKGRPIAAEDGQFTLCFSSDGKMTGMGACNRLMADYDVTQGRELRIGPVAATRMMCRNGALETEFLSVLEQATHYEMDGPMLMLLSNGSLVALFEAQVEQPEPAE